MARRTAAWYRDKRDGLYVIRPADCTGNFVITFTDLEMLREFAAVCGYILKQVVIP